MKIMDELKSLYSTWPPEQQDLRRAFERLSSRAAALEGASCSLVSRPGVSHSFRTTLADPGARPRPVFFLADVVAAPGDPWFLSVCFYEDEITDPDEIGNAIPQGLFDETGYCFDVDDDDGELAGYLEARMDEAWLAARRSAG